jgi:hypothetical protein
MRRSGWRTAAGAITISATAITATAFLVGPMPAHASVGTTRYTDPQGSGTVCTKARPCPIETAVDDATVLDTVIVEPGRYGSTTQPITTPLANPNAISIRGSSLTSRPVIYTSAPTGIDLSNGGRLANLVLRDVTTDTDPVGILVIGTVEHVTVVIAKDFAIGCRDPLVLLDSVCIAGGASAWAIILDGTSTASAPTLSGVTAQARGAGGEGLEASADDAALTVSVDNSIVHGRGVDLEAQAFEGAPAVVAVSHSDYETTQTGGDGSTAAINPAAGNIKAPPTFVNASANNFAEAAASPTINAGGTTPTSTTTDVLGNPRVLGSAPDMGAYEFLQRPTASGLKVTKRTTHAVHITVAVNPEGLSTHVVLTARLGKHHLSSHAVSAGTGRKSHAVHLVLHGLDPGRSYTVHAVATNKAGGVRRDVRVDPFRCNRDIAMCDERVDQPVAAGGRVRGRARCPCRRSPSARGRAERPCQSGHAPAWCARG